MIRRTFISIAGILPFLSLGKFLSSTSSLLAKTSTIIKLKKDPNKIKRINHTGTHPVHTDLTIPDSIAYYQMIGPAKKEARLRYLQQYWTSKVKDNPNIILNTPTTPDRSCAISNVGIKNMKPAILAERLMKEHKIFTVAIDYANVHGCRITPNLYTTTKELDVFVDALNTLSKA